MKSIILYTLGLISLALSCNILDLELVSLKMGLKATSRTVPVNTLVTLNCSTSKCAQVEMYTITLLEEVVTKLECDTIDINGILICHNITIMEPVKVRCAGRHSSEMCHSWGSILIGIEESATTVPYITQNLPCNCSSSTEPTTSQENKAAKSANLGLGISTGFLFSVLMIIFIFCCCYKYLKRHTCGMFNYLVPLRPQHCNFIK